MARVKDSVRTMFLGKNVDPGLTKERKKDVVFGKITHYYYIKRNGMYCVILAFIRNRFQGQIRVAV